MSSLRGRPRRGQTVAHRSWHRPYRMERKPRTPDAPFVGRDAALTRLEAYRRDRALVVVTGPPGVGKTRLLEEAGETPIRFGGEESAEEIWATLARAWGAAEERREAFEAAFTERPGPLVLDALPERHAAAVLGALLDLPDARVVVATRVRPGLAGEQVLELEPLTTADGAALLLELVERTRGTAPTEDERPWASEVATAVGCLPLALELCAGRARMLGLRAIHHRLSDSLAALGPSLEVSLRASWDALGETERMGVARLVPLTGGAPIDALEALLGSGGLDTLARLRERSLLVASDHGLWVPRPVATLAVEERAEDVERGRLALAELLATTEPSRWARREAHALARTLGERGSAPAPVASAIVRALVAQGGGAASAALERLVEPLVDITARSGASVELVGWAHLLRSHARMAAGDEQGAAKDRRAAATLAAKGEHATLADELRLLAAEEGADVGELGPAPADPVQRRRWEWLKASADGDESAMDALATGKDRVAFRARHWLAERGHRRTERLESILEDAGPGEAREVLAALEALAESEGRGRLWEARRLAEQLGDRATIAAIDERLKSAPSVAPLAIEEGRIRRGTEVVDVARRPTLRRVLEALVAKRLEAPGEALAWDTLLEAGWPGQKVGAESGVHRVRVAVSTLRKLGLADVIETVDEGYRLAPDVPLA